MAACSGISKVGVGFPWTVLIQLQRKGGAGRKCGVSVLLAAVAVAVTVATPHLRFAVPVLVVVEKRWALRIRDKKWEVTSQSCFVLMRRERERKESLFFPSSGLPEICLLSSLAPPHASLLLNLLFIFYFYFLSFSFLPYIYIYSLLSVRCAGGWDTNVLYLLMPPNCQIE